VWAQDTGARIQESILDIDCPSIVVEFTAVNVSSSPDVPDDFVYEGFLQMRGMATSF